MEKTQEERPAQTPEHEKKLGATPSSQSSFLGCKAVYSFAMVWPLGGLFFFVWCSAATSVLSTGVNNISDSFTTLGLDITEV